MSHLHRYRRVIGTLGLVFVLSVGAFADTIRLKDGSIIKGRITSFGGGVFVVSIGEGSRRKSMTFGASEIDSIKFDDRSLASVPASNVSRVTRANYDPPAPRIVRQEPIETAAERVATPTVTPRRTQTRQPAVISAPTVTPVQKKSTVVGKPVELAVRVLADNTSNGWTNSGWVVKRGQRIRISGDGTVSLGGGKTAEPSGLYDVEDDSKLMKSVPTGALIAVIGDDNNEFIYVGSSREFTASRDGSLFLGVNEGNLSDNTGAYNVKIEITSEAGI